MSEEVNVSIIVSKNAEKYFNLIQKFLIDEYALDFSANRYDDDESMVLWFRTYKGHCLTYLKHDIFRLRRCGIDISFDELETS